MIDATLRGVLAEIRALGEHEPRVHFAGATPKTSSIDPPVVSV
jgi:hypothetical protein